MKTLEEIKSELDKKLSFVEQNEDGLDYWIPELNESERRGRSRVDWVYHLIVMSELDAYIEQRSMELGESIIETGTLEDMLDWIESAKEG